jgi:hypothetical protein
LPLLQVEPRRNTFDKGMGLSEWNIVLECKYIIRWKIKRLLCPLLVSHLLQSFLTTSMLLPSFDFQDSTF